MADVKQAISIPAAIVIAGAFIAAGVYFSQVGPKQSAPLPTATPRSASLDFRPISSTDHIRGPENAKVTILEYSDFECPYCRIFHQSMLQLMQDHPNDVRWVFRHAPIASLHPNASGIANAAQCASAQGKFWEFADSVFAGSPTAENPNESLPDFISRHAKAANIPDMAAFQSCVDTNANAGIVQSDLQDGIQAGPESFGTPFNVIITKDGKKIEIGGGVPYSQLTTIIGPLLQ